MEIFPQLGHEVRVMVECVSCSLLRPGTVFHSEKPPKSLLFPNRKFRSAYDWHTCTVPVDKPSVTARKPGFVFSSRHAPLERPSRSLANPNRVFCSMPVSCSKGFEHNMRSPVPTTLSPSVTCKCVDVSMPCVTQTVKTMFTCMVCTVSRWVEASRAAIKRHVEQEHGMFTCRNAHCIAGFKSETGRDIPNDVHMPKKRSCPRCAAVFQHRYMLQRHMVLHQKRPSFECARCNNKYFRKQDLKEHMQTTHGGSQYPCQTCAYIGKSARALKQHALVHKGPSMCCLQCNQSFRWCSQVAAHKCK